MSAPRLALISAVLAFGAAPGVLAQDQKPAAPAPQAKTPQERLAAIDRLIRAQKFAEAETAALELLKLDEKSGAAWAQLGVALHFQKKLDEALAAHLKAAEYGPRAARSQGAYNAACVYSLKNDVEKALPLLKQALEAGFGDSPENVELVDTDPDLANLRGDARFADVVAAIKSGKKPGAAAKPAAADALPAGEVAWSNSSPRMGTRLAFFSQSSSSGQVAIDYGAPAWKDEYDAELSNPKFVDHRWRLGQEFWTTLDASLPVTIGTAKLNPGSYYLTVEKKSDGRFLLAFLDPVEVRKAHLDPFVAHLTKGGIEIEMQHGTAQEKAAALEIKLTSDGERSNKGKLTVRFGPHELTAPVVCHLQE